MPAMNAAKPVDLREREPFPRNANYAHKAGFLPFPLPARSKADPPTGCTGYKNSVTHAKWRKKLDTWLKPGKFPKDSSIGVRLPEGIICLDVDAYKEGGAETIARIEEETGVALPDTWRQSARRDGISGHYLYRVPKGLKWPGKAGPGVETVHYGHRYLVSSPSIHEDQGKDPNVGTYWWYTPGQEMDGEGSLTYPKIADLPELPEEWIDYLTSGQHEKLLPEKEFGSIGERNKAISEWLNSKGQDECSEIIRLANEFEAEVGVGAHDLAASLTYRLVALAAEGHRGLGPALERVRSAFVGEVARDDRAGGMKRSLGQLRDEWGRLRDGAIKKVMLQEDNALFEGYPEECHCAELNEDGSPKRTIDLGAYDLVREVPHAYISLSPNEDGYGMYLVNDQISQLIADRLERVTLGSLRLSVQRATPWIKTMSVGDAKIPVPAVPPDPFLNTLLASEERYRYLPVLRGRTATPFYARGENGPELVAKNGYHAGSQMFLEMTPEMAKSVAGLENGTFLERALEIIEELLADFPFVDKEGGSDKATVYAALVLPFVRDLVEGQTPLHMFHAPMPRTGKSLLVDAICTVVSGAPDAAGVQKFLSPSGKEPNEELGKRIVAALRKTPTVVAMDNINFKLECAELDGVLTTYPIFNARVLHSSDSDVVGTLPLWLMTANNVQTNKDMLGRIVPCRLDARRKNPEMGRSFDHPNLVAWARENRPALVWAVLTLVQHWIEEGEHEATIELGGFERWTGIVGGILESAGIGGLLAGREDFAERAGGESNEGLEALIAEWAEVHKTGWDSACFSKELTHLPALDDLIVDDGRDRSLRLGKILRKVVDAPIGNHFVRLRKLDGKSAYYLEATSGTDERKRRTRKTRLKGAGRR